MNNFNGIGIRLKMYNLLSEHFVCNVNAFTFVIYIVY